MLSWQPAPPPLSPEALPPEEASSEALLIPGFPAKGRFQGELREAWDGSGVRQRLGWGLRDHLPAMAAAASLGPSDCPFPGLPAPHPLGT